jgi:transposase
MAMTIVEMTRPVMGGVDTHADVHVAAVIDANGGVLGVERRFGDVCDEAVKVTLARRVLALDADGERLDHELEQLVPRVAPGLLDVYGVGVHTAAILLVAAGDNPHRLKSEAAFAHLCGVAPLPASSGKTTRHRLNPGGNRQANHAL